MQNTMMNKEDKKTVLDRFARCVTSHTKSIVVVTFVGVIVCAFLALLVTINYNLSDYLPESSESTRTLSVMEEEFEAEVPNARVMVKEVSLVEALEYKEAIRAVPGVTSVAWLDDMVDLQVPLETQNQSIVEQYYRNGDALIEVRIAAGVENEAMDAIYDIIGEENSATGEAVTTAEAKTMAGTEGLGAILILVPIIIVILILSTTSWAEPIFFLLAIGISVIFNLGTNLVMGEISFITFSIAPVLQMAVSLDYAIFLLHSFRKFRETESDAKIAMQKAMKKSFSAIAASAATTFFGFMALGFMEFRIGTDLGIALLKGIALSFLCVMIFLPAFTLMAHKLIDKTKHRQLIPPFKTAGNRLAKLRIPIFCLVIIMVVPCFLAQQNTAFSYGMGSNEGSPTRASYDTETINDRFGQATPTVVLVPRGDVAREAALAEKLEEIPRVSSVIAYTTAVGTTVPLEFLDQQIVNQFYSPHYARIIVYADTTSEGDEAFAVVEQIRSTSAEFYDDAGLTAGQAASLYDVKLVVTEDNKTTNFIAIGAIALVLLLVFRSISFPIILLATIESAIFINLAVPYFTGEELNYVGFLVINTVQLGATVDYAILFSDNYKRHRQALPVRQALTKTLNETFFSILVSASILASAGAVLWLTSSNNIVSVLGLLLLRGTAFSFLLVVTFLPGALLIFDKIVGKTTWRSKFFDSKKEPDHG